MIHSTDTHGYTEAVFGLTHLLGFSFAPRIKGIGKQTLHLFKPKQQADPDWIIGPDKTINEKVIHENWDDLLRLVATIKLKENTASDIFQRLNSYSRQHALCQTLKAFGQIIKFHIILRYVRPSRSSATRSNWPTASPVPWPLETPRIHSDRKGGTADRESLQPADPELYHLLELSLLLKTLFHQKGTIRWYIERF